MADDRLPRVTMCVFAYNQEDYIDEAIAGAFAQDYRNLEILMSDDCSPDGTFARMEAAAKSYRGPHAIRLNRNATNLHLAGHINVINQLAEGELLVIASGDDISLPHRVRTLVETWLAQDRRPGLLHSACFRFNEQWEERFDCPCLDQLDDLEAAARNPAYVIGATEAWDRRLMNGFGGLNAGVTHEDHVLAFRTLLAGRKIAYVDEPLVRYRQGSGISTIYGDAQPGPAERRTILTGFMTEMQQKLDDLQVVPNPSIEAIIRRNFDRYSAALEFERGWPSVSDLPALARRSGLPHVLRMVAKRLRNQWLDRRSRDDRSPASFAKGKWPDDGLEHVDHCPVCGSTDREVALDGLRDTLFNCAPGAWTLQRCGGCQSAYLDPRPDESSIGQAYGNYHTHEARTTLPAGDLRGLRYLQRVLANGYKNWKFGTQLAPASPLGVGAAWVMPRYRALLDRQMRNLRKGQGRVLDLGFGDGSFLDNANAMGWDAEGIDFDPETVENARRRGLDVRDRPLVPEDGPYDVITMCHVIEHLHDPKAVLRTCFEALAPGGTIWIETPNAGSFGMAMLGRGWRGLEPPRHLVLFNRRSIERALVEVGFAEVRDLPNSGSAIGMFAMSPQVRAGTDPAIPSRLPMKVRAQSIYAAAVGAVAPAKREFIALTARKPA